jgi:hypothetical protein
MRRPRSLGVCAFSPPQIKQTQRTDENLLDARKLNNVTAAIKSPTHRALFWIEPANLFLTEVSTAPRSLGNSTLKRRSQLA